MGRKRIVIVGGGFAGVECARRLRKKLARDAWDVVIFNRENHMVFHPMLAEVAGGSLNPDAVAAPLRQMLPGVGCRTEDVEGVDLDARELIFEAHDGRTDRLGYDHLVLSCGSDVNLGMVPGMADHAFPLKTVGDAVALRAHVMQQLERAEVCSDVEQRRWYLSFVVVGGGYSGVESAGEINDLARSSRRFFQNIAADDIRVSIIHSRDQLLPEISSSLRDFTKRKMEATGIDVLLEGRVSAATARGVVLKDGREVEGGTVVCTIGTTPTAVVQKLEVEKERGRLLTEPDMRLRGREDVWAMGDCAVVMNAHDDKPSPPTGQFAARQGRQLADNLLRVLAGKSTVPFSFKPLGQMCAIGGKSAVAEVFGRRVSGFVAWVLWRGVYLSKLPSFSRKVKVGFDWMWELFFSRDLVHLRGDTTSRVSHAYYRSGDVVFHEGDPAADFYVIETGKAEVVKGERVIATLDEGDFFGEMALLSDEPRSATVRAAADMEVVIVGSTVFNQVSESLAPLRKLLTEEAERRREGNAAGD